MTGAAAFMEKAGGYRGEQAIPTAALYAESFKELLTTAMARGGGQVPHQAPRFRSMPTWLLETIVVDVNECLWHQAYAWWELAQAWSALGFDDRRSTVPMSILATAANLEFDWPRSKATGEGEKVQRRPAGISYDGYFVERKRTTSGPGHP